MPCQRLNLQCRRTSEKKKEDHLHISVFLLGVQRKAADACVFLPFMMAHDHIAARYFGVVTSFTVAETFTTYSALLVVQNRPATQSKRTKIVEYRSPHALLAIVRSRTSQQEQSKFIPAQQGGKKKNNLEERDEHVCIPLGWCNTHDGSLGGGRLLSHVRVHLAPAYTHTDRSITMSTTNKPSKKKIINKNKNSVCARGETGASVSGRTNFLHAGA